MDIVKTVEDTLSVLRKHIAALEEKANDNLPTNMKVEQIPSWTNQHMDYIFTVRYDSYYKTDHVAKTEEQINNCVVKYQAIVNDYIAKITAIHSKNVPALESNKKLKDKIEFMMKAAGIPPSYTTYEFPTARSKTKKSVYNSAGYLGDLQRNVIVNDYFDNHKSSAEKSIVNVREEATKRVAKIKEIERQAAKEKAKADAEKVIVHLRVKYATSYDADHNEILEAIIKKDKYLYLAHFLEANRIDWNDGPSYAESGLNGFDIETEEDEKIYNTINDLVQDWGGDGRVFRDCEYGYGYLYSKVAETNPDLFKDHELIKEKINAFS